MKNILLTVSTLALAFAFSTVQAQSVAAEKKESKPASCCSAGAGKSCSSAKSSASASCHDSKSSAAADQKGQNRYASENGEGKRAKRSNAKKEEATPNR